MITDRQVRGLWKHLSGGMPLWKAALKSGMDEKTARKYREGGRLPSEAAPAHCWRTRPDPFKDVWAEVFEQLELSPDLRAKTLFQWLQRKHPGDFQDTQLRTFQRGVKAWRATEGPPKEVFFRQVHHPGRLCASDFTFMNDLGVTIQGQRFDHLRYHFVLTYSNWEWASICFSESFESLSDGLQEALWRLGGVPERHRSDRMSAAVNNLSDEKEFTHRYRSLMRHHGLESEKTQAGKGNENGDVESSHRHFKDAVDQALMLRGSREFESRLAYAEFLHKLLEQKNAGRQKRLAEELALLGPLPERQLEGYKRVKARVDTGSLIRVGYNTYSVNSRLIGERVEARIHADHLEVWYGQRQVERLPRLRGRGKHHINYRHVIDSLVRKPGAFEDYRYREEMFPTSRFRMAYDALREAHSSQKASKEYLTILRLAARENESATDEALRVLLDRDETLTAESVEQFVAAGQEPPAVTDVTVEETDLSSFDELFADKEVCDGFEQGCESDVDWLSSRAAPAYISGDL